MSKRILFPLLFVLMAASAARADEPAGEVIIQRYPNGAVHIERRVVQNKNRDYVNHGLWTEFQPNGKKVGGGPFVLGKRHGVWTRWFYPGDSSLFSQPIYQDYHGPFLSEANFVDGKLDGFWTIYDGHKKKISEWSFHLGVQEGPWVWYYGNGIKRREMAFAAGKPVGKVLEWSPEGKSHVVEDYVNGHRREFRVEYFRPNQKRLEGWYIFTKEITKTTYDWWTASADTVVLYAGAGQLRDGAWTWWYPHSQKQVAGSYVIGQPNGHWIWWFENGQKWQEGHYVLGEKSGRWTTWAPNGVVEKDVTLPTLSAPPQEKEAVGAQPGSPAVGAPKAKDAPKAKSGIQAPSAE